MKTLSACSDLAAGSCTLGRRGAGRVLLGSLLRVAGVLILGCGEADPLSEVRALQDAGQHREAVRRMGELIDAAPRGPGFHFEYAKALIAIGERTRAIWPLRTAVESDEFAIEAGSLLAQVYLATGNAPDAVAAADEVLALDAGHRLALLTRSRAHAAAKRPEDALSDAEAYLDLFPDDLDARLHRVSLLLALDRVEETERAIALLADGMGEDELQPEALARLCAVDAVFTWEKGQRQAGEAKLADCLERFPDRAIAVGEAVALFDQIGDVQRANQTLRRAIEAAPENLVFRNTLAGRLRAAGDREQAEQVLRDAIPLVSGAAPWLMLHDHFVALKDYAAARSAIEQALALEPHAAAAVRLAYADDLILVGDLAAAERVARNLAPPSSHLALGRILLQRREPAAALEEFEQGLRLWPDNPTARWLAGRAAEQLGDFPVAIAHYRESVRSDAGRTPAAKDLAELYALMGAGQNAVEFATRFLRANPTDAQAASDLLALSRRFGIDRSVAQAASALAAMPGQEDRFIAERALDLAARGAHQAAVALLDSQSLGLESLESLRARTRLDVQLGELDAARSRLDPLLAKNPDSVELLLLFEEVQRAAGASPLERRVTLERAMAANPSDTGVHLALSQIESELGSWERAVALLDAVPPEDSAAPEAALRAIQILQAADADATDVEARLVALLDADPRQATAALALAEMLAARDPKSERALVLARRALFLGQGAAAALVMGRVQVERGEYAAAIEALELARADSRDGADLDYWIGRAREGLGDVSGSLEAYRRLLGSTAATPAQRRRASDSLARLSVDSVPVAAEREDL